MHRLVVMGNQVQFKKRILIERGGKRHLDGRPTIAEVHQAPAIVAFSLKTMA